MLTGSLTNIVLLDSMMDPRDHVFAPRHKLVSKTEKKRVFKVFGLNDEHVLPKILITDPMIQAMVKDGVNVQLGDLIEIERESLTSGVALYYREVVLWTDSP